MPRGKRPCRFVSFDFINKNVQPGTPVENVDSSRTDADFAKLPRLVF